MSAIAAKRLDKAEQLLTQIPRESTQKLCRMNLLLAQGRPQTLIDAFQDQDFAEWSDFQRNSNRMAMSKLLSLLVLVAGAVPAAGAVELIRDGQPLAEIVVSTGADPSVKVAARELQKYLEKISGAKLTAVSLAPVFATGRCGGVRRPPAGP